MKFKTEKLKVRRRNTIKAIKLAENNIEYMFDINKYREWYSESCFKIYNSSDHWANDCIGEKVEIIDSDCNAFERIINYKTVNTGYEIANEWLSPIPKIQSKKRMRIYG